MASKKNKSSECITDDRPGISNPNLEDRQRQTIGLLGNSALRLLAGSVVSITFSGFCFYMTSHAEFIPPTGTASTLINNIAVSFLFFILGAAAALIFFFCLLTACTQLADAYKLRKEIKKS